MGQKACHCRSGSHAAPTYGGSTHSILFPTPCPHGAAPNRLQQAHPRLRPQVAAETEDEARHRPKPRLRPQRLRPRLGLARRFSSVHIVVFVTEVLLFVPSVARPDRRRNPAPRGFSGPGPPRAQLSRARAPLSGLLPPPPLPRPGAAAVGPRPLRRARRRGLPRGLVPRPRLRPAARLRPPRPVLPQRRRAATLS